MSNTMLKPLRILYAAGPGNIIGTYQHWLEGRDDPSRMAVTFSGQFYDICKNFDADAYVVSSHQQKALLQHNSLTLENRPKWLSNPSGIRFHLNQVLYGLKLMMTAIRWKANVVVAVDGTTHWFILSLLSQLGVQVIPSIHCVLWCQHLPRKRSERWINQLSQHLFKRSAAILVASNNVAAQIKQITNGQSAPILEFLPLYRRDEFSRITPPDPDRSPFRVLYIGRIEESKGVFDLLDVAKRLAAEGRSMLFELCGDGSALPALKQQVAEAGLNDRFIFHGYCNKPELQEALSRSHVVIAPTKATFVEGFCQVVAEGILSGRPVVTSSVCPALSYVRPGVVEIPVDNIEAYGDALIRLCDDRAFYEEKRQGATTVQEQFYDPAHSWGMMLKTALLQLQDDRLKTTHPMRLQEPSRSV